MGWLRTRMGRVRDVVVSKVGHILERLNLIEPPPPFKDEEFRDDVAERILQRLHAEAESKLGRKLPDPRSSARRKYP